MYLGICAAKAGKYWAELMGKRRAGPAVGLSLKCKSTDEKEEKVQNAGLYSRKHRNWAQRRSPNKLTGWISAKFFFFFCVFMDRDEVELGQ